MYVCLSLNMGPWITMAVYCVCVLVFHNICLELKLQMFAFRRTFRCRSNFCPDRGSNPRQWGTSASEAKVLTTGPPVVPYAPRLGQGFTPHSSPQASRLLSRGVLTCWWVSEMLKRSVEESREKHAAVRSEVQDSDHCSVCDVWISRRGHHFGGLSDVAPTSALTEVRNLATGEPLHRKHRSWPLDQQWCLMLTHSWAHVR